MAGGLLSDVDLWSMVNTILVFKGGGWQVVLHFII